MNTDIIELSDDSQANKPYKYTSLLYKGNWEKILY